MTEWTPRRSDMTDSYIAEWLREIDGGRLVMSFEHTIALIREVQWWRKQAVEAAVKKENRTP